MSDRDGIVEFKLLETHALRVFESAVWALSDVMADPDVQEIMVNRPDDVWVERMGVMRRLEGVSLTGKQIVEAVKSLATANGGREVTPVLDCRLPGLRIAAALDPVALGGPSLCIRKHARSKRTLNDYLDNGGFAMIGETDPEHAANEPAPSMAAVAAGGVGVRDLLRWIVRERKTVLVAGSTGSGKTTFLNALLAEVPPDQRVITVEDTAELQVALPNYKGFESAPEKGITIRSLVRLALRFRPDRIIVGEIRGAEAYDLLDALNTGHEGGACTLHADSPLLALARLESLVRMNHDAANVPYQSLREQISQTIDFVVFCNKRGARRGPEQIVEVLGVTPEGYQTRTWFDARA